MPRKDTQRYTATSWEPLTGPLFDVADRVDPGSVRDQVWLEWVREDIAVALECLVLSVGRLYRETPPGRIPKLTGAAMGELRAHTKRISQRLDRDIDPAAVEQILWRFARTFGYVIDDPEPSPKQGWPLPGPNARNGGDGDVPERLFDKLLEDVAAAVHGQYPQPADN